MYESFFGFVKRPFLAVSTLDRYFPATSVEQTCQTTTRAIARGEGPVAIFGGSGLGKTMCCLRVAENFRRNFEVIMLASSQLITRRALLQSLLFELRMPYRDMSEGELRLTLMNRLQPSTDNPTDGLVLIVDEAQTLSMKLLEELRLLTNVVRNGVPRVRLILCGTMRMEECLAHPMMESLNQRLAARCYLMPLSMQETGQYVKHKMELSGVDSSSVVTRDALEAIYRGSDGIPRLIDQLADQSLMLACQERERPVSAAMIGRAWCMLQQLPNPWSEPESIAKPEITESFVSQPSSVATTPIALNVPSVPTRSPGSNIEYGQLQDDDIAPQYEVPLVFRSNSIAEPFREVPMTSPIVTESPSASVEPVVHSAKKNLFDVFAGDFDEEFSIPVQSSTSYNAYSGAAYGNLNHDLSSFGTSRSESAPVTRFEIEEANDFLSSPLSIQPSTERSNPLANAFFQHAGYADSIPFDSIPFDSAPLVSVDEYQSDLSSNISSEQAANLERQIEEEMRELVSGLNMSAMTFDPEQAIASDRSRQADQRLSHQAHSDVLSFAGLKTNSRENPDDYAREQAMVERAAMNDDRDLLVIEEDLEAIRGGSQNATATTTRAVLHPYAKLFTKLRNS
jgi:general secretion pathway protein A